VTGEDSRGNNNPNSGYGTVQDATPREQYRKHLKMWEDNHVTSYSYDLYMGCFCQVAGWMQIMVQEGAVTRVDSIPGQYGYWSDCALHDVPKVEDLFQMIDVYLDNEDYTVQAEYHYGLGYPTRIQLRRKEPLPDSDVDIQVTDLRWWCDIAPPLGD
jgi:hypothetical protein